MTSATSTMTERIATALERAGLGEIPGDVHANLADHGMDSLLVVLCVAELESEFSLAIPPDRVYEESFGSVDAIRELLEELVEEQDRR